jgi:hypothetical protein
MLLGAFPPMPVPRFRAGADAEFFDRPLGPAEAAGVPVGWLPQQGINYSATNVAHVDVTWFSLLVHSALGWICGSSRNSQDRR